MRISRGGVATTDRDRTSVRRTIVRRRPGGRRSDRSPTPADRRARRPTHRPGVDDGPGCGPRRIRARDRARTPHGAATSYPGDRGDRCTTGLRPERAARPRRGDRTRCALGCARSSRQTVTTLGAARLQHRAAGAGAHPRPEAMLLGTATVVRLVGALHAALLELPLGSAVVETIGGGAPQRGPATPGQPPRLGSSTPAGNHVADRAGHHRRRRRTVRTRRSRRLDTPARLLPFAACVVHIVWTTMWTSDAGPEGGAGE